MQSVLELFRPKSHYSLLSFKETYLHINDQFIHDEVAAIQGYLWESGLFFPHLCLALINCCYEEERHSPAFQAHRTQHSYFKHQQYFLFLNSTGKKQDFLWSAISENKNFFMDFP